MQTQTVLQRERDRVLADGLGGLSTVKEWMEDILRQYSLMDEAAATAIATDELMDVVDRIKDEAMSLPSQSDVIVHVHRLVFRHDGSNEIIKILAIEDLDGSVYCVDAATPVASNPFELADDLAQGEWVVERIEEQVDAESAAHCPAYSRTADGVMSGEEKAKAVLAFDKYTGKPQAFHGVERPL